MRGTDLTQEQIGNLLRAYMAGGINGSAALAKEYNVTRRYPADLARQRGLSYDYGYKRALFKLTKDQTDIRWKLARERGAVIV